CSYATASRHWSRVCIYRAPLSHDFLLTLLRPPLISPLFPYTTLFRSPGTEIVGLTPTFGADSCEGNVESYLAAIGVLDADLKYRSEEHTSELQSRFDLVCRLLLEKKKMACL